MKVMSQQTLINVYTNGAHIKTDAILHKIHARTYIVPVPFDAPIRKQIISLSLATNDTLAFFLYNA